MEEIQLDPRSRDVIQVFLYGLRQIFLDLPTRLKLMDLLERYKPGTRKNCGRPGMDVWNILVLAGLKQALHCNYDLLTALANHMDIVRQMLRHGADDRTRYTRSAIHDNVSALSPELLVQVNCLVVKLGHRMVGKPEGETLKCRCDSKPVKTNVRFPTDLLLLWDSVRCLIRVSAKVSKSFGMDGWLQHKSLSNKVYREYRAARKGQRRDYKLKNVRRYLRSSRAMVKKYLDLLEQINALEQEILARSGPRSNADQATLQEIFEAKQELCLYLDYIARFSDQIQRRIFEGEQIPTHEKIYSIFKPFTRWIVKGKAGILCELGVPVAVIEDEDQFVLGYGILWEGTDKDIAIPLVKTLEAQYPGISMTCSFDRAFYSPEVRKQLDEKLEVTAMPKKGGRTQEEQARQNDPAYQNARKGHAGVESCMNHLNHRGLSLVRETSSESFERVVATSVLAANIHRLGTLVRDQERKRLRRLQKQRKRLRRAA